MLAAYFMKRNDLLLWLSIVWLAVWCVATITILWP
jgi:hypothetical protein